MFVGILVSATSLVLRFRRATGLERQQLKWVASAAGLVGAAFASGPLLFWYIDDGAVWEPLLLLAIATIPVSAGIAILRYRLYEIDRIVNRAVVYGAVSALLVGAYFGIVLGLQEVFSSFGGGSDLAIAVSTLAVAALFRPVRARVQRAVDRRFYRRRYDAQRTLEAFSARLRDEIDIAALHGELTAVVRRTLEPERVSLWLRPAVTDAVTPAGRRRPYNRSRAMTRLSHIFRRAQPQDPAPPPDEARDLAAHTPASPAGALDLDIAPNDPLVAYFESASGAIDVDSLELDSPALAALTTTGVKLVVPLVSQGELIGLLNLGPRLSDQDYSTDDRRLLDNLAAQAAPALRVGQLVREQEIPGA